MDIKTLEQALSFMGSQDALALQLGITQGAVQKALTAKRNIFVITGAESVSAIEVKSAFNSKPDLLAFINAIEVTHEQL